MTHGKMALLSSLCFLALVTVAFGEGPIKNWSCDDFNGSPEAIGDYWSEAANCTQCIAHKCGFCLSSLRCSAGDASGPGDRSPCPHWLYDSYDYSTPEAALASVNAIGHDLNVAHAALSPPFSRRR